MAKIFLRGSKKVDNNDAAKKIFMDGAIFFFFWFFSLVPGNAQK